MEMLSRAWHFHRPGGVGARFVFGDALRSVNRFEVNSGNRSLVLGNSIMSVRIGTRRRSSILAAAPVVLLLASLLAAPPAVSAQGLASLYYSLPNGDLPNQADFNSQAALQASLNNLPAGTIGPTTG